MSGVNGKRLESEGVHIRRHSVVARGVVQRSLGPPWVYPREGVRQSRGGPDKPTVSENLNGPQSFLLQNPLDPNIFGTDTRQSVSVVENTRKEKGHQVLLCRSAITRPCIYYLFVWQLSFRPSKKKRGF